MLLAEETITATGMLLYTIYDFIILRESRLEISETPVFYPEPEPTLLSSVPDP